jgi:hypothetical protein
VSGSTTGCTSGTTDGIDALLGYEQEDIPAQEDFFRGDGGDDDMFDVVDTTDQNALPLSGNVTTLPQHPLPAPKPGQDKVCATPLALSDSS